MNQFVKFGIGFSIITGIVLFSGTQERFLAWADDGMCKSYEDDPYNLLEISHGGVEDTPIPGNKEEIPGAFTVEDSEGFTWMKLMVCRPTDPDTSPEDHVEVTVKNGTFLNEAGDPLGNILQFRIAEMSPATVFRVKAETPSQHVGDIEICAKLASDESGTCRDPVNATAVSIAWIDDEPDYARYATEYEEGEYKDNGDSDNFFLRHLVRPRKDDGTPDYSHSGDPDYQDIDLWYRIMPEDLRELDEVVKHVRISIYREDTLENITTIEVDQEESLEELDGEQVYHVVWNGTEIRNPVTSEFTVAGFYRVQLEAEFNWGSENGEPVTLTMSIEDGDEQLPGWQCPQDGLAIHDLAFKHRPDIYVGSNENVAPNGPVYPFSPDILEKYRLYKETMFGGGPAWEEPPENYYADWLEDGVDEVNETTAGFPFLASIRDSSYPVLKVSAERDPEKHYIDIKNPSFKITNETLENLKGKIREEILDALELLVDEIFPDMEAIEDALKVIMYQGQGQDEPELTVGEKKHLREQTGRYTYRDCVDGEPYLLHRGHSDKHPNYAFIQYWMYATASHSPYHKIDDTNVFIHEGEWEMVQIALQLKNLEFPAKKSEWLLPYAITAAQHFYGQTLAWRLTVRDGLEGLEGDELVSEQRYVSTTGNGNRIKVYVAEDSHATYFRDGEIDAVVLPWQQKAGVQIQYEQASGYYDGISEPEQKDYNLLALDDFERKGISDWPGYWGLDAEIGPNVRSPGLSEVEDEKGKFRKAVDPVRFHNSCRKLITDGNFDPKGTPDPETELK